MNNSIDLQKFTAAHRQSYAGALAEIRGGIKYGHWMWYIFPQVRGLGHSPTSDYYGIASLEEAKAFLADPYLGGNLLEICGALLALDTCDPVRVFGHIDAKKLRSSMTLFACASDGPSVFGQVLDKFFGGKCDRRTRKILHLD